MNTRRSAMRRFLAFMVLLPAISTAQYDRPGSTDGQFLKIGVSPRGTAMSDAFIAAVRGAEATYYNASSMPWVQGTDVVFNHNRWFAGINHEFLAATHNFGDVGVLGISAIALYTDEMIVRTPLQPEGTGETFYTGNYKLGLSYARFLTDRVTVGATMNYIHMLLYRDFKADAFSIDISTTYVSDFRGFRFSMAIANFGSNIQYVSESYPLPTNFTFGAAMNAIESEMHNLLVSFSAVKPNEGQPLAQVGAEWSFNSMFFLRGGYRINHPVASYSFGGGVSGALMGYDVRFDYSYSPYERLGAAHRLGVGIHLD